MALGTFSKFYFFNEAISSETQNLNFNEGSGELLAQIQVGSYTMENITTAIKTAMDASGTQEYTVTFDRASRRYTISATSSFDLLTNTGSQVGTSAWSLLGFATDADKTGATSYTSDFEAGSVYFNQFQLQDYVDPEMRQERIQPAVNESASGILEVISFGVRRTIEMNMLYITDLAMDGKVIKNNPNGKADAEAFMQFLTTRAPLEFMADENLPGTFFTIQLEKTPTNGKGVGYFLKEETGKNLPGFFTTGKLQFRVI